MMHPLTPEQRQLRDHLQTAQEAYIAFALDIRQRRGPGTNAEQVLLDHASSAADMLAKIQTPRA